MGKWAKLVATKYVNGGTATVLMGAGWLYLWVFPWYEAYAYDPRWGHNYAEALAFLATGLAYFNRRLISDLLALVAAFLIVPASLEIWPVPVTAILGVVLVVLIVIDMFVKDGDLSFIGDNDIHHHPNGRSFPGAIRPEQPVDRSVWNIKGKVFHRVEVTEFFCNIFDL